VFGLRGRAFYAADIAALPALSEAEAQALLAAAMNPENAARVADPVSAVDGWKPLRNDDHEALFGVADAAQPLLFGANGRAFRARLDTLSLEPLPLPAAANLSTALVDGADLIVVGSAGVQRLALPR
jgi:hypothetical protein